MKKTLLIFAVFCMTMLPPLADAAEEKPTVLTEAEQLLIDSIKGIKSGVSQTIDFAKEQVPDVIHQLVVWNLTYSLLWSAFGLVIVLFGGLVMRAAYKNDYDEGVFIFLGLLPAIVGIVICFNNLLDAVKIWVAPKVWLLEYAACLMKGH